MDIQELREKSIADLHALLATERNHMRELRFKASEGQLKQVHQIAVAKQNIARIMTVINQKRLAAQIGRGAGSVSHPKSV